MSSTPVGLLSSAAKRRARRRVHESGTLSESSAAIPAHVVPVVKSNLLLSGTSDYAAPASDIPHVAHQKAVATPMSPHHAFTRDAACGSDTVVESISASLPSCDAETARHENTEALEIKESKYSPVTTSSAIPVRTLPSAATLARMNQKKRMYLMRGAPGSGKTTLAVNMRMDLISVEHDIPVHGLGRDDVVIYSTDDYWTRARPFHPYQLTAAHAWNVDRARRAAERGVPVIFIDNTNIQLEHMSPYVHIADRFGYEASVVEPNTAWKHDRHRLLAKCDKSAMKLHIIVNMLSKYATENRLVEPDESVVDAVRRLYPACLDMS